MNPPKMRRCACMGWLQVDVPLTEFRVEAAVSEHQKTPRHRQWWQAQEYADERDLRFPVAVLKRVS